MNPLLLLHGAIGSSSQLLPLQKEFGKYFSQVPVFDFPGHGGKGFPAAPFSIQLFAESVLEFLDSEKILRVDVFGYSMGGYVALYLARHFPERVGKIFTLATKLDWNEGIAAKEVKLLNPEKILEKVPQFAEALEKSHAPNDWKMVLDKTSEMMLGLGKNPSLGNDDFLKIGNRILLTVGERDMMVSVAETENVFRRLKNAEFNIIADTPHPIEQVDVMRIVEMGKKFFVE